MAAMATLAAAFRAFGARGKNPRWSWSARTPDDRIVMTFWQDRFLPGQPLSYSNIGNNDLTIGQLQLGNQERLDNLQWAQHRWDGLMGVVIIRAVDPNAQERNIAEAFPRKDLLMRLSTLLDTGEFSAENVGTWEQYVGPNGMSYLSPQDGPNCSGR
jgi:hypothetical protein